MRGLLEVQSRILSEFLTRPYYERHHYSNISLGNRINGIVGARGTGKTTFLIKTAISEGANQGKALYATADSLFFLEHTLLDLADWAYKETDIRLLCIDVIHKYENWNQELKNIYDACRNLKVHFTGSSMIDIISSKYDLSRRVSLYPMVGLSFREFLEFYCKIKVPLLTIKQIISDHVKISQDIDAPQILKYFREYIRIGYYPHVREIELDTDRYQSIENIVQKTIYEDIAVLHSLKTPTLRLIERLFKYVINSQAGELSVTKLSNRLGKDFDSISNYLSFLDQAGLVHFLYPKKSGHAYLRNPVKILPDNPNLIYAHDMPQALDSVDGKVRETFFVSQLRNSGHDVYYCNVGDYEVEGVSFEIGGKNKTNKQIKGKKDACVLKDGILIGEKSMIPLFLMGMLY